MRTAGTDAIGAFRWGLRRYAVVFVLCLVAGAVLAPYWALHRKPPLDATALVIGQRLDMQLSASPGTGGRSSATGRSRRRWRRRCGAPARPKKSTPPGGPRPPGRTPPSWRA